MLKAPYIPNELLDLIFSYDGRIKWREGKFVNIISKKDGRRPPIENIVIHKINILKTKIEKNTNNEFYIDFQFKDQGLMGLCFDYKWSYPSKFEICFYNFNNGYIIQKRFIVN
jgi:hypothetical protein